MCFEPGLNAVIVEYMSTWELPDDVPLLKLLEADAAIFF